MKRRNWGKTPKFISISTGVRYAVARSCLHTDNGWAIQCELPVGEQFVLSAHAYPSKKEACNALVGIADMFEERGSGVVWEVMPDAE